MAAVQSEEIEVLKSIYGDDFEDHETAPPSFTVHLEPNPGCEDNYVIIALDFTLPEAYPEVVPEFVVRPVLGLTKEDCDTIRPQLDHLAKESKGMSMVFTLASAAKEWLDARNADAMRRAAEELRAAAAAAAEAERRANTIDVEELVEAPAAGTLITEENFQEWRRGFMAELAARRPAEAVETGADGSRRVKLTGRQLFERDATLAKQDILVPLDAEPEPEDAEPEPEDAEPA